jgi:ABC-type glycerol-3-phosphate transport system substrate-binding protein
MTTCSWIWPIEAERIKRSEERQTVRNVSYIALVAGALLGCSSDSDNSNANPQGGNDTAPLRIATYLASPDEQAALQSVIDAYHARHPGVPVELKPLMLSPPQTIAQLTGAAPIEGGWDLAIHTFTSVPGVVDVTLDLNTLPALAPLKANYHPAVAAGMQSTGIWAGMPLGIAGFNIAISNRDALNQLGVTAPPTSLDELLNVCSRYVQLGKGAELPVPIGEASDEFGPLVVMAAFLPGSATFGGTTSETDLVQQWRRSVGALKTFADNGCVYLVDDKNGNGSHHDENFDRTITGKNALGVGPVWGLGYFIAQGQVERGQFGFGPLIGDEAGFIYTVELVTANKASANVQAVTDFLAVAGDPDVQVDYLRARGGTPAALFDHPSDMSDPELELAYSSFQTADTAHRAGSFPGFLLDLPKAVGPLRALITGTGSRDEVVETYLCKMTRHPAFTHYESEEACIAAVRAVP